MCFAKHFFQHYNTHTWTPALNTVTNQQGVEQRGESERESETQHDPLQSETK